MLDKREKVPLVFVGFLENIDYDFSYIAGMTGTSCDLPRYNRGEHKDFQDYCSEETEEIVEEVYSEDIKMLGYNFCNTCLQEQLTRRSTRKNYSLRS